jgi:hypothetical protein
MIPAAMLSGQKRFYAFFRRICVWKAESNKGFSIKRSCSRFQRPRPASVAGRKQNLQGIASAPLAAAPGASHRPDDAEKHSPRDPEANSEDQKENEELSP